MKLIVSPYKGQSTTCCVEPALFFSFIQVSTEERTTKWKNFQGQTAIFCNQTIFWYLFLSIPFSRSMAMVSRLFTYPGSRWYITWIYFYPVTSTVCRKKLSPFYSPTRGNSYWNKDDRPRAWRKPGSWKLLQTSNAFLHWKMDLKDATFVEG
jgi:hypothetical protein